MRELQPVNQNVILDVSEEVSEQKTAAGIIIPDTAAVEKPIRTASPAFDYRLSYTHTSGTVVYYLGTK